MRFSIIMPVYNAEATLAAALASVCSQSFADWELLCVDDGSTDGSAVILADRAARDSRIRVFHQANAGVGAARNRALALVRGEFFLFLDADDLLMREALSRADALLSETKADGLLTAPLYRTFTAADEARAAAWSADLRFRTLIEVDQRKRLVLDTDAPKGFVCGRIYRTSVFGEIRFPIWLQMMEDLAQWADAVSLPARWAVAKGAYYAYRVAPESASRVRTPTFYFGVLAVPRYAFPPLARALALTPAEKRRAWRRLRGTYAGFLRSLFLQWSTFTDAEREILDGELQAFRAKFSFEPFPLLTRLRAWCVFHGCGNGGWVDWIEGPLTHAANGLRALKRRIGR